MSAGTALYQQLDRAFDVDGARPAAEPVDGRIPKGRRNATLASMAGSMRRRGMTEAEITAALRAVNERCDPALSDRELETIAQSMGRYAPAEGHDPACFAEEDTHAAQLQKYLRMLMDAYNITDAPVFVWERQFLRLDDDAQAQAFTDKMLEIRPLLIIFDAFLDLHSGDGFTGSELRPILDRIVALPQLMPCGVLILDHPKKEDSGRKGTPDPVDALYGGRMKSALADTMILTKRTSDSPPRFTLSIVKTPERAPRALYRNLQRGRWLRRRRGTRRADAICERGDSVGTELARRLHLHEETHRGRNRPRDANRHGGHPRAEVQRHGAGGWLGRPGEGVPADDERQE